MSSLSVAAIDPGFVAVAKALYGDGVDPRELWDLCKMAPASTSDQNKKRLAAGLVAGTTAEALATARTIRPAIGAVRGLTGASPIKRAAKVAELGLQAGNMAIGLGAAHALAGPRKGRLKSVGKAAPRLRGGSLVPVSKGALRAVRMTEHLASAQHHSFVQGIKTDAMKQQFAGRKGRLVPAHAAQPPRGGRHATATRSKTPAVLAAAAGAGAAAGATLEHRRPAPVAKTLDLTFEGTISKVDADKRQVFGWCSLSVVNGQPVVDLQNDHVSIEEIEKSAYAYVLGSRKGGDMHRRVAKSADGGPVHTATLIESMVFTPEKIEKMGLPPDSLPLGWWVGYHVDDDEQWADVKAGKRLGFSIHGTGVRKAIA